MLGFGIIKKFNKLHARQIFGVGNRAIIGAEIFDVLGNSALQDLHKVLCVGESSVSSELISANFEVDQASRTYLKADEPVFAEYRSQTGGFGSVAAVDGRDRGEGIELHE